MSLARDVIDRLRMATATIASARNVAAQIRDRASQLQAEVGAATDGSSDPRPGEAIVRWQQARVRLDEAIAEFEAGQAAVETYIAELEGGGGAGSSLEAEPRPIARPSSPTSAPRPRIPGFTHQRPVPEAVAAVRREGWPKNSQGQVSARGHLYDRHGTQINDDVLRPYFKGEAPPCDELWEPWRSDPDYTTTWHAERDAAKMMRDKQIDHAVLYLNVSTCGRESRDPKRCDANLERILPRGSELYVWTIHEDGYRARRRYKGNGDAIND